MYLFSNLSALLAWNNLSISLRKSPSADARSFHGDSASQASQAIGVFRPTLHSLMASATSAGSAQGKEGNLKARWDLINKQRKLKQMEGIDKGQWIMGFGEHRGKTFLHVWEEKQHYVKWFLEHCNPTKGEAQKAFNDYLAEKIPATEIELDMHVSPQDEVSPPQDEVSPPQDKVSPPQDKVSPHDDVTPQDEVSPHDEVSQKTNVSVEVGRSASSAGAGQSDPDIRVLQAEVADLKAQVCELMNLMKSGWNVVATKVPSSSSIGAR